MRWVKFSERWPNLSTEDEVIVRSPDFQSERKARYHVYCWIFSDCTDPLQNCFFDNSIAEWLED